jgi:hypothetical protein
MRSRKRLQKEYGLLSFNIDTLLKINLHKDANKESTCLKTFKNMRI